MSKASSTETVKVMVRVRPMNKSEVKRGCQSVLKVDKVNNQVTIVKPDEDGHVQRDFAYDSVYDTDS